MSRFPGLRGDRAGGKDWFPVGQTGGRLPPQQQAQGDECSPGPLGLSQKRRVADLLANYIPEDEALLLRSGR